jgi:RimJ/RimL family protein N-acetyltransferase
MHLLTTRLIATSRRSRKFAGWDMILVDDCRWPHRDRLWCHMISDTTFDELHSFARELGIPRIAFQGDHYDLHEEARQAAIDGGATPVPSREIVRALRASSLRRGPALQHRGLQGVVHLPAPSLVTPRLVLRQWRPGERPDGMTQEAVDRHAITLALRGFGLWAVTLRPSGTLIGAIGLSPVPPGDVDQPGIQINAQLDPGHQRKRLGFEGCAEALNYGFSVLGLERMFAIVPTANIGARRFAHRLGLAEVDASTSQRSSFDGQEVTKLSVTRTFDNPLARS